MTYREAEQIYGISYSVIYRHLKNPNINTQGGQTALSKFEENLLVSSILVCTEWGYPLVRYDIRYLVKGFLDRRGKKVRQFKKK